ncbi:helix-turn-helix domain-containing protein [Photobacterium sp. SP02]|uniref:helix-turn-helix domain-containing protein n=1 Tax=Photobacterium sp. SP02 TaxID=3032280 RepID=UPI003145429E
MSIKVMTMVWDSPAFSGNTKLIMLCLADYANDEGLCWPSIDSVARKCSLSRSTVKAQLKKLGEQGVLSAQRRKKTTEEGTKTNDTNLYQIHISVLKNTLEEGVEFNPRSKSDLGQNSAGGRSKSDPKPSLDPSDIKDPPKAPLSENSESNSEQIAEGKKRKRLATSLPDDFAVTDVMQQWYAEQGFTLSIQAATQQWRDAMLARGQKYTDWVAAWRNGMRNANKWASERGGSQRQGMFSRMGRSSGNYGPPEGYR